MTQRYYGPVQGAGVAVIETESDKAISPSVLGVTAYVGILEKGPTDRVFRVGKKKDFLARAGSYIPQSLVPDAAFDFYDLSNGAGELWAKRITDGTGVISSVTFKSRTFPHKAVLKVSADNVGRWAGKKNIIVDEYVSVTAFTLTTGKTMKKNEYKDAVVRLAAVPGKSYKVLSNTTAGVLTFASDTNLITDINGSVNLLYSAELSNDGKQLAVVVKDGEENPTTEFGLDVYENGALVLSYPNLSMDPSSKYYVESVVNDDASNYYIKVDDLNTGAVVAATRPANFYGKIKTVSALVLSADIHEVVTSSPGNAVATLASVTYGGSIQKDTITLTCTVAGPLATFTAVSALQGALANVVEGTAYTWNAYGLNFTLNKVGVPEFAIGDVVVITLDPFPVNAFAGGILVADYVNFRRTKFSIASNTVNTITVKVGQDLTSVAAIADEFMVIAPSEMGGGYDGIEDVVDSTYIQAFDTGTSQLNSLFGQNLGLVKLACPGVTASAVQKAGLAYAEAKNYQFRVEIPSNIVTEEAAEEFVNSTIGRSDMGKTHWPSYGYVSNPLGSGLKLVSLTGMFHGREAQMAKAYGGYHKVAGGIDVKLPNIVKLPTGQKVLDEEFLNPIGINVVKFKKGNAIMWGARSLSVDPAFKFIQHREQLSHYENILRENFDFIVFAINDTSAQGTAYTSLLSLFLPEFDIGAIRGNSFAEACSIKIDEENNTNATLAAGDLNAEIKLRLADTVERFKIKIGKAGIFESLA
jgi:hypothetical protein